MSSPDMCYIGKCRKCDDMLMVTMDMLDRPRDVAESVGQCIRGGGYIERISVAAARPLPPFCTCEEENGSKSSLDHTTGRPPGW